MIESKCRSCGADIVWLKTWKGKNMPVDAESYHGEPEYMRTVHVSHFETCPDAAKWSKKKKDAEKTDAEKPPLTASEQQERDLFSPRKESDAKS